MQLKYIALLLLCLVAGLIITPCPVLASSSGITQEGKGEEVDKKEDTGKEDEDPSHGGGGGQHGTVSDDAIINNLVGSFKVLWNWCCTTKIFIGSYCFTFAQVFLFEILAGILIWFLSYILYYS